MTARVCISLFAACALLTACGQRGALYLPDEARNVIVSPAQAPAAAAPADAPAAAEATPETEAQRRSNTTAPAK